MQQGLAGVSAGIIRSGTRRVEAGGRPLRASTARSREQSQALVQAAQASESLGQVSQALQQLELALTLAQQTGDRAHITAVMESLGRTYLSARKPDAAVQYLTQALAMATSR